MAETDYDGSQTSTRQTNAIECLIDEKNREVAENIGHIAIEWSRIHDRLSRIFAHVTQINQEVAYAIWNSIPTDSLQRQMLQAAVNEAYKDEEFFETKEDIIRVIRKLNKASSNRNNFIHCPFAISIEGKELVLIPNDLLNNKHAKRLKGSEILTESQEQYRKLLILNELCYHIIVRLY